MTNLQSSNMRHIR